MALQKKIMVVFGTRPEAIKLAPVLDAIAKNKNLESRVCITQQHTDLLAPILKDLGIEDYYQFKVSEKTTSLDQSCSQILGQFEGIFTGSKG